MRINIPTRDRTNTVILTISISSFIDLFMEPPGRDTRMENHAKLAMTKGAGGVYEKD